MPSMQLLLELMQRGCQLQIFWVMLEISLLVKFSMVLHKVSAKLCYHLYLYQMLKFLTQWSQKILLLEIILLIMILVLTLKLWTLQLMSIIVEDHGLINIAQSLDGSKLHQSYIVLDLIWLMINTGEISANLFSLNLTWHCIPKFSKHLMHMEMETN